MSKQIIKKIPGFLLPVIILILFNSCFIFSANAQNDSVPALRTYRVGIFAPMYLDSIFTPEGTIRFNETIPKFITQGLDFVHGAQIALDSMPVGKENISAFIYDTKSYTQSVAQLIDSNKLDTLDLIIGSVKDADFKQLADFALAKKIPFISATYPNDGGIVANPYLVVVNSTLKAHCEAIYSYLLQNHGTDLIYLCRQPGSQEDIVASYFTNLNEQDGKALLDIQIVNFDSNISPSVLQEKLDSNRQSVIIGGSLDETFAGKLTTACFELQQSYPITLLGMPNWDNFRALMKKDSYTDFPVYVTTPYFNNKWDVFSKMVSTAYSSKYKGRAGDMVFKGFECTHLFIKLLVKYPNNMMAHLNDKNLKVFSDYNFRPIFLNKGVAIADYYENKHLYFIKIMNGTVTKAW
jgi:ABC-type branched-subunit amino acid transport system substrate-binding protein